MKRTDAESFEVYKTRRREANKALRTYRKGSIIWNNGTYIKAVHGKIGYQINS